MTVEFVSEIMRTIRPGAGAEPQGGVTPANRMSQIGAAPWLRPLNATSCLE
jgi:hypothetical protein